MACGTEDFVIEKNRNMRDALKALGIPINYYEEEGNHDWIFWNKWLLKAMEWIVQMENKME